ncbi:MAG: BMFP domain-containing protein YqiC [Limisphaerales bacterium]|jgi:BMFP domain-containing protein YqiC
MDPIQTLLSLLRTIAPSPEVFSTLETRVQEIFKSFALVPRAEYEAHLDILETLRNQVTDLEARLDVLDK